MSVWRSTEIWLRGAVAATISGAANGIVTGMAAIGIDPRQFNLAAGFRHTLAIAGVSAALSAILGVALYLKQSPLPASDPADDVNRLADPARDGGRDSPPDTDHDQFHFGHDADPRDSRAVDRPRP